MITNIFYSSILTLIISLLTINTVQAQDCEIIQFQRGHSSMMVDGVAPPDSVICYAISTAAGQTANIAISGTNMMFSIDGVTDAQDKYQFTTGETTYTIRVSQFIRSITAQMYTLTISIH